ncbi:unnamed protein product [Trichobilharzia regenti]|nr:unnamed protein product [Trichobilharzia regenti]
MDMVSDLENALCPRKTLSPSANSTAEFRLTWNSKNIVVHLLQTNPVTAKEKLELYPRVEGASGLDKGTREERQRGTTGRLMGAVPQIPTPPPTNWNREASDSKKQLINSYRQQIVHQLNSSQVVIISGPPGCGKTTILPQILMDECFARGQRCRMICSQPRRLYAHINAERLAHLRGENVGQTIGYQIRLESKYFFF